MKTFLSKFLPVILAVANVVGSAFIPQIGAFWSSHPAIASALAVLGLFLPQPHK